MDMFMDKLAQRLTAQEIIDANTSADMEEVTRLRNQVAEFDDCLARLKQLVDEIAQKVQEPQAGGAEIDSLLMESIGKINALSQDTAGLEQLKQLLMDRLDEMDKKQGERLGSMSRITDERLEDVDKNLAEKLDDVDKNLREKLEDVDKNLAEKLEQWGGQSNDRPNDQLAEQLTEQFNAAGETVHKECVKVYRNVQAVVTEESGKQTEALTETKGEVGKLRGKLGAVLGFSVAAFILSLLSAAIQVLNLLNINLF